jgi:hypothetical protein
LTSIVVSPSYDPNPPDAETIADIEAIFNDWYEGCLAHNAIPCVCGCGVDCEYDAIADCYWYCDGSFETR